MVLQLVNPDHPLLRTELEEFDFSNPPVNPGELANNLIETMTAHRGLGLSANQCGLPYRAFVLWSETPLVCFNPRVVDQTSEQVMLDEGCLSFPHLFLKVKRPSMIKARFQTSTGEMRTEKFIGMTARAFLHELDHMNGVLFTSKTSRIHLSRAQNQQKQLTRKLKRGEAYIKPSEVPALERINVENFSTQ
jgi:peptide deformylase